MSSSSTIETSNADVVHSNFIALSPTGQQEQLWQELQRIHSCNHVDPTITNDIPQQIRYWPNYDQVLSHLIEADYTHTLTCPYDIPVVPSSSKNNKNETPTKTLCPHGVICCANLEIFPHTASYTGLLQPNQTLPCLLRLSSAIKPPSLGIQSRLGRTLLYATSEKIRNAQLFPCAALKVFRQSTSSGNLLFGGSKVGQCDTNFFAHCVCTTMTEQMPRIVRPFVRKFWTYSDYPLSLGISNFCQTTIHGETVQDVDIQFPFAIILQPSNSDTNTEDQYHHHHTCPTSHESLDDPYDRFLEHTLHVPVGTILYQVFACPTPQDVPDASKLEHIGRIITTSNMTQSSSWDGLSFRHQRKEEDYALRPSWPNALRDQVTINQGQTTDTIGKLAGWKLFEQHIAEGSYIDFEKAEDIASESN